MTAPQIKLRLGALVLYKGAPHKVLARDEVGVKLRSLGECPVTIDPTHAELAELYFGRPRRFQLLEEAASGLPEGVRDNLRRDIESFDVRRQDVALLRLDYVLACTKFFDDGRIKKTLAGYAKVARIVAIARRRVRARLEDTTPDAVPLERFGGSTLKGWYTRWRKSGRKLAALIPLDDNKGRTGFRIDPEVDAIFTTRIREDWLLLEGPPLSHVILAIQDDVGKLNEGRVIALPIPDEMTIRRWVKANVSQFDIVFYREGPEAAEQKFRHVRKAQQARRPLEIVEIDHTPLDVLLLHGDGEIARDSRSKAKRTKRVWLTVAICAATRMLVGFHIADERPSWTSVMACLRMATCPRISSGCVS